ncbi:MAG: chromosome partitioning protein ParA, partial [Prevotellaceae bacterium]|nr:chromosome partitioning protein ParA [Prevotellaceae bacterium]
LLDSVPAHMMADAALLSRICDLTVYVIRVGGIDRRYLPELQRIYAENRYNNLCVLLNGVVESGSGYGYAYSYNYGYGYSTPESRKKLSYRIRRKIKKFLRAIKRQ